MTKTKLTKSQVKHVAKLAALSLSEKKIKKFQKQLSDILNYVDQLGRVVTAKVPPTSQVTGLENVFRADEIAKSLSQNEALSGTKQKQNGYIKTKAVFS
jgi:aspartyl-tRNA(Asn)/glutamyl-tRNA(Gln) amidotransferase subunit C